MIEKKEKKNIKMYQQLNPIAPNGPKCLAIYVRVLCECVKIENDNSSLSLLQMLL